MSQTLPPARESSHNGPCAGLCYRSAAANSCIAWLVKGCSANEIRMSHGNVRWCGPARTVDTTSEAPLDANREDLALMSFLNTAYRRRLSRPLITKTRCAIDVGNDVSRPCSAEMRAWAAPKTPVGADVAFLAEAMHRGQVLWCARHLESYPFRDPAEELDLSIRSSTWRRGYLVENGARHHGAQLAHYMLRRPACTSDRSGFVVSPATKPRSGRYVHPPHLPSLDTVPLRLRRIAPFSLSRTVNQDASHRALGRLSSIPAV
jgi:hypothetical protein